MVKHIILWTLKDEYSAEQKAEIKKGIKANLEALIGGSQVPSKSLILLMDEVLT